MSKTALITGGSGGIGKQTAIHLAKEGYRVIITGRSHLSCTNAIIEIIKQSNNPNVDFIVSDFNSLKSIKALADEYLSKYNHLDILINNVGILKETKEFTDDGLEKNFAINVMAPYLLSKLLFNLLSTSKLGKIITLSGGVHPTEINFNNLQAEKSYLGIVTYSHSKLVMMTLMIAFGKTIIHPNIKSNICYPGQASTSMTRALTPKMFPWIFRLAFPILKYVNRIDKNNPDKSAQKASRSSIFLALNPNAEQLHNSYINYKCKNVKLPNAVTDFHNQHQITIYANKIIKDKLGIDINNLK